MGISRVISKEQALQQVKLLVNNYQRLRDELLRPGAKFAEADVRTQFIEPLLSALGWDVTNKLGLPVSRMEVVAERSQDTRDGTTVGRPDYKLRIAGKDIMPIEAKRPQVRLLDHSKSSQQARSYGWSLSLPASVLTNFEHLIIFDTTRAPSPTDSASHSRIPSATFSFSEYVTRFDELWKYLSYASLSNNGLEAVYNYEQPPRGESPFDKSFLADFRHWRQQLAQAIAIENADLSEREVGRRAQKILNAFLFLRVCEDRNIAKYKKLYESASAKALLRAFKKADKAFNAGLFTTLEDTRVDDELLMSIVADMYWPRSQYAYGLLEPEMLSDLYEQYLGEQIVISEKRQVYFEEKPEVMHAGGVVSTPQYIVERIVRETITPLLTLGASTRAKPFTILDPAVGSGTFLIEAFQQIINAFEDAGFENSLSLRKNIAEKYLYGIDIDPAAVEVARLSILLLIIGNEDLDIGAADHILPSLESNIISGNTVVRGDFDRKMPLVAGDVYRRAKVSPLDPETSFSSTKSGSKFDAIIGNPPYVRIQELSRHYPDQLSYLQREDSGYESAQGHSFDLYQIFIERSFELLKPSGRLGMIIPNRFTSLLPAAPIRKMIGERIEQLVHFRENQVFPGRTTYTAIIITGPKSKAPFTLELVDDLERWKRGVPGNLQQVERSSFGPEPWPMSTSTQKKLFEQLQASAIACLGDPGWVEVFVGVQTSRDELYFIRPRSRSQGIVTFVDDTGVETQIEADILRPAIKDQPIEMYDGQPEPDRYAIFPYRESDRGSQVLLTTEEMKSKYPLAWAYFLRHKERLAPPARSITPDPKGKFWAFGRSQSLSKMGEPKLIVRVLSLTPRYALDTRGLVVPGGGDGGPYYLLRPRAECPYSIYTIQAILSHPAVDLFVAVNGKRYRGSYASHRKAFLVKVPIPELSETEQSVIESNTKELQSLAVQIRAETDIALRNSMNSRRAALREHNEETLSRAYGLEAELLQAATE